MYGQNTDCGIQAHAETQRMLAEVFAMADIDNPQYWQKMTELSRLARADGRRFVRQALLYEVTQQAPGPVWSLSFQLHVAREESAEAIAPLLYCDNRSIREAAQRVLRLLVQLQRNDQGELDLSYWRHFVRPEIANPLRRAVFETQPVAAFLFFSGEWTQPGGREGARGDMIPYRRKLRVIDNALYEKRWLGGIPGGAVDPPTRAVLRELAESEYWWSRLFVAEVIVQNKEFHDGEIVKRLTNDDNELVRNSIASLTKPDPLRATPVDR